MRCDHRCIRIDTDDRKTDNGTNIDNHSKRGNSACNRGSTVGIATQNHRGNNDNGRPGPNSTQTTFLNEKADQDDVRITSSTGIDASGNFDSDVGSRKQQRQLQRQQVTPAALRKQASLKHICAQAAARTTRLG